MAMIGTNKSDEWGTTDVLKDNALNKISKLT